MRVVFSLVLIVVFLRRFRFLKDFFVKSLLFLNFRVVSDGVENIKRCGEKFILL